MKIDLKVNRDADLYARYAIEVFLNAAIPPDMIQTLTRNNCKISQLEVRISISGIFLTQIKQHNCKVSISGGISVGSKHVNNVPR